MHTYVCTHKRWSRNTSMHRHTHTHTHTHHKSPQPERDLSPDFWNQTFQWLSVGFPWLFHVQKWKGGTLPRASQQGQIYIWSRAVKIPPPAVPFLLLHNGLCVLTHIAPPPIFKNRTFTTTLSCFLKLSVTHSEFSYALSSCVHSSLLILKPSCWDVSFFPFLSFHLLFFFSQQEESSLSPPVLPLIHPTSLFYFPKRITSTSVIPVKEWKTTKKHLLFSLFLPV